MNKPDAARFTPQNIIPTSEQLAIQLSKNRVTLVKANAGAAKTTTLALRIGEAIARNLAPENMLALVFTPEARDVLKKRLTDIGIPQATAERIRGATFEDFSSQLLEKIEGRKVASIAHIKDLKPYIDAALENVCDNYLGKVDYLVSDTTSVALSQFFHTQRELKARLLLQRDVEDMALEDISDEFGMQMSEPLSVSTYLAIVEYEKLRAGQDDRTAFRAPFDATYDLARLLDADPSTRTLLPRYRLILCDELHDLNEASFAIVQALIDPDYTYFIGAGDIDQVIHSKLGASEDFMRSRFQQCYPATTQYPLTYSFRYGPHLAYAMEAFKGKPVESALALRSEIEQLHYDAAEGVACADLVVKALQQWKKAGRALDGCAILIRDTHQSVAVENALMQAEIGYRTLDMARYLEREEILFLRGMIAIALGDFAATPKALRGAIFDAVAMFAEVSLGRGEQMSQFRQAVIDEPDALRWFYSGRVDQRGAEDVKEKVAALVDRLQAARTTEPADHVLGELRQQLNSLLEFARGAASAKTDPTLSEALQELEQQVLEMVDYLERHVMTHPAETLLQVLRNNLLTLLLYLERLAANDVKQRMARVVDYMQGAITSGARADIVLRQICALMDIEALAKRLYVHPQEAAVVSKSIAGFIAAAEKMQMNLAQFSEWIGQADAGAASKKRSHNVKLTCVRNAKGKEFEHVILPFMEQGEFPFARANSQEEDNLFYVAATRAISCLTLISPKEAGLRSAFIGRMKIAGNKARADAAVDHNASQTRALARTEFKAYGDDWAAVKAMGAHWDFARKIFYLKDGQDRAPFARWL
jgi:DNA helicase II / ATP-dependent DNA helicase PcrA